MDVRAEHVAIVRELAARAPIAPRFGGGGGARYECLTCELEGDDYVSLAHELSLHDEDCTWRRARAIYPELSSEPPPEMLA